MVNFCIIKWLFLYNQMVIYLQDLQFFTGESMNADGLVVIHDYKEIDGEEHPVFYFMKYGLVEEKL